MIRFAEKNDIDGIMEFIDTYWKKGHILGNDKEFFKYEHLISENEVSYVISEEADGINAILGYIPYGKNIRDVMTVMWKANHTAAPSLGLELLWYLKNHGNIRIMASPGSNPNLRELYRYLGYYFGKMTRWYRLRPMENYQIARICDAKIPAGQKGGNYVSLETWEVFERIFDFENYDLKSKPYKEAWYIKKRYYEHPIYHYEVYGIYGDTGKVALSIMFRVISVSGNNVLRFIDAVGDFSLLAGITGLLDALLEKYDAEYVDCYETGLADIYMRSAGWLKTEETNNIIPNYFSPFLRENIDIYYFSSEKDIVLFKGDGDQDRPNR